jgi:hypothetical protein
MKLPFEVIDSHIHYFLSTPLMQPKKWAGRLSEEQVRLIRERFDQNLKERDQPPMDTSLATPGQYADRWSEEFRNNHISAGIFLSLIDDPESLRDFISCSSDEFIGYAFVDPLDEAAPDKLTRQVEECGFRGLKLIATNQWFHAYDQRIYPLYERAGDLGIPILIHFGVSIGYTADFRYANPLDLQPVLRDFPGLNFILAHFGAGFFREALLLCYQCENVYLDTSSSNIWIKYQDHPQNLKDVFRISLEAVGPERIIFGTDSSYFPRGFRSDILETQYQILLQLRRSQEEMALIFGGNIRRLIGQRKGV